MKNIILSRIKTLEAREFESVNKLNHQIDSENKFHYDQKDPKKLVLLYQCINDEGKMSFFDNNLNGIWANASDDVPILRQLLLDPHLIIDLKPVKNEDECFATYGLTSTQLVELARQGLVAFNLYAYESGKKDNFSLYQQSECEGMIDLLDFDSSRCRINSIRKEAFFDRILKNEGIEYKELISEFREKVSYAFLKMSENDREDLILKKIIRPSDISGNIETIVQQYAYVKASLAALKKQGQLEKYEKIQKLMDPVSEDILSDKIDQTILLLRGLKNCIATPYTASMGGVYNMSTGALNALYHALGCDTSIKDYDQDKTKNFDPSTRSFLEYIEMISSKNHISIAELNNKVFDKQLSDKQFSGYVDFIKDIKGITSQLNSSLKDLTSMNNSKFYDLINQGKSYYDIELEIVKEIKRNNMFKGILGYGVSGLLNIIFGFTVDGIIGTGIAGIISGASQVLINTIKTESLISEDKRRIMCNLNNVKGKLNNTLNRAN